MDWMFATDSPVIHQPLKLLLDQSTPTAYFTLVCFLFTMRVGYTSTIFQSYLKPSLPCFHNQPSTIIFVLWCGKCSTPPKSRTEQHNPRIDPYVYRRKWQSCCLSLSLHINFLYPLFVFDYQFMYPVSIARDAIRCGSMYNCASSPNSFVAHSLCSSSPNSIYICAHYVNIGP
jgi:hypothetical protein